jgi:hypothetical protein
MRPTPQGSTYRRKIKHGHGTADDLIHTKNAAHELNMTGLSSIHTGVRSNTVMELHVTIYIKRLYI